jgi:putative PEP-CTERM system TPR-repeat lipoprotein
MQELALAELAAGRTDEATRWLEKARALEHRSPAAAVRLVDVYISRQQPDKALDVAKGAEGAAPENIAVLAALARAYLAMGDAKTAQSVLGRMTRLASFDPGLQTQIAAYQLRAGNPAGAALSLDRAFSGKPDYLPALTLQTELDLDEGAIGRAESRAKAIVARNPHQAVGYRLVADAAMAKRSFPEAIAGYQLALTKEETTDGALRLYRAFVQSGNSGKATAFLETWVASRPRDFVAMRALAEGHLGAGNLGPARAWYERVLKEQGDDPYVLNNLANILLRQGQPGALEYAERAFRLAPKDPAIQDTLGWLLVQRGEVDLGLRHLREARLREPQRPEIRYHLAAALARVGRSEEARRELEPAVQANAAFDGIDDARALLKQLSSR